MISIIANIIGSIGKANQKKKPMPSSAKKTKNTDYSYRNQNMAPEANQNYNSSLEYDNGAILQDTSYNDNGSYSNTILEERTIQNEPLNEIEETYDIGLSELQHAIVMSEVLDKPLALRRR